MNSISRLFFAFASLIFIQFSPVAVAAYTDKEPAEGIDPYHSGLKEQIAESTGSEVKFISGGIGEEMEELKQVQNQYNLKLLLTAKNGMYLSDVQVQIADKTGQTVLDTVTTGPVLLVKLPAGSYTVTATKEGETRKQKVNLGSSKLSSHQFTMNVNEI